MGQGRRPRRGCWEGRRVFQGHWCLRPWAGGGGGGAGRHAPPPQHHPVAASTPPCGPQLRSCCPWSRHTGDRAGPSGWGNLGLTLGDPQSQPLPLRAHWKGSLRTHAPIPGLLMAGRGRPHTAPPPGDQGTNTSQTAPGHGGPWWRGLAAWGRGRQRLPLDTRTQAQGVAWHVQVATDHRHGSRGLGAQQSWDRVLSWGGPLRGWEGAGSLCERPVGTWLGRSRKARRPGLPRAPPLPTSIQGTAVRRAGG